MNLLRPLRGHRRRRQRSRPAALLPMALLLVNLQRLLRGRGPRGRLSRLLLLALLLQQTALLGYACPLQQVPAAATVAMSSHDCHPPATPAADSDNPLLCQQHCLRDHVTTVDLKLPPVPALALPPLPVVLAMLPPAQARHYRDVPVCLADPPPIQRFCSLQI